MTKGIMVKIKLNLYFVIIINGTMQERCTLFPRKKLLNYEFGLNIPKFM